MTRLDENARTVLAARYLLRDADGELVETPEQLFARVAGAVAAAEETFAPGERRRWQADFEQALGERRLLPNSPTLMNAGTALGQLSACFVLPLGDSLEAIHDGLRAMSLVQRTGGGTGFDFTPLRPRGAPLRSSGGTSSGPVSFVHLFDAATGTVRQGGRRRGANMGLLRVDHPDVREFVEAKSEPGALSNFNLSVAVTDAFMQAAADGAGQPLRDPTTGREVDRVDAAGLLDAIAHAAWRRGDPGLVFLDALADANPTPGLGPLVAVNPCGEVPLLPYESCTLASINLAALLDGDGALDWRAFRELVHLGVRFLDDVVEVNRFPLPELGAATRGNRKIGLGLMGLAEVLLRSGLPYASLEAVAFGERLARVLAEESHAASVELGRQRGPYPHHARWGRGPARRNATVNAIAPTGTLSLIAGTSASIEPLFALAFRRHVLDGRTLTEVHPAVLDFAATHGLDVDVLRRTGRLPDDARRQPGLADLLATALEIAPEAHLAMQAAFQRHVDNAVSKTVNLPEDARPEDVTAVYRRAWELRLKGVTVFRYGSRDSQVLELGTADEALQPGPHPHCEPDACRL